MPVSASIDRKTRQISLGQFFTKGEVSRVLASFLDRPNGASMVDLGAGDGRLSQSVSLAWQLSRVVTIDVDANASPSIASSRHFHIHGDALDVELPGQLSRQHGVFDLAVCNPPYVKQIWRREFSRIIDEAGLSEVCPVFPETRGEILFLAQLLRIIKSGGQVGLIIPDGPITGERHRRLRRHLLTHHRIERVVSLPPGMFVGTEARAHILILRKGVKPRRQVTLMELDCAGALSPPLQISSAAAEHRLDYSFHAAQMQAVHFNRLTLRQLGAEIVRGNISSSELGLWSSTFHTSDFPMDDERIGIFLEGKKPLKSKPVAAGPSDVLVARVGRNLENGVCRVSTGYAYLSDCIFRVRLPAQYSLRVYDALVSNRGREYLRATARGVGARYLTVQSLLDFSI